MDYKEKYLKYKQKYLELKQKNYGGAPDAEFKKLSLYSNQDSCAYGYSSTTDFGTGNIERFCNKNYNTLNKIDCIEKSKVELDKFNKKQKSDFINILLGDVFEEIREKFEKYDNAKYNDQSKKKHNYVKELEDYLIKNSYNLSNLTNVDELHNYLTNILSKEQFIVDAPKENLLIGYENYKFKYDEILEEFYIKRFKYFYEQITRLDFDKTDNTYNIKFLCKKLQEVIDFYFVDDKLKAVYSLLPSAQLIDKKYYNMILLNPIKYHNVIYNNISNKIQNIDTLCAEGNRIYADKDCKIGSTTITSCIMFCIFLLNGDMIVSHFNGIINNIPSPFDDDIKQITKYDYVCENGLIKTHQDFKSILTDANISHIFIGGVLKDYIIGTHGFIYKPEYMGQDPGDINLERLTPLEENYILNILINGNLTTTQYKKPIYRHSSGDNTQYIITNSQIYNIYKL